MADIDKELKNKEYVVNTILRNPTFLLTRNILFDVRGSINYNTLTNETVFWLEEIFIPFLENFSKICEPVIAFCQKHMDGNISRIKVAKNDKTNYHKLEEQSESMRADVVRLEATNDENRNFKKEIQKKIAITESLERAIRNEKKELLGRLKYLETKNELNYDEKIQKDETEKSIEKIDAKLTTLESHKSLNELELKNVSKNIKELVENMEKINKTVTNFYGEMKILLRKVESNADLVDTYDRLIEEKQHYIGKNFFSDKLTTQFCISLWNNLKETYFNVRTLFSEEVLEKQLEQYIKEEYDLKSVAAQLKSTKSDKSTGKKGKDKHVEKKYVSKVIPDLDKFLKKAYVRDVTKTSVDYETQISMLQNNIASIERRKHELNEHFVKDAVKRSKSSDQDTSELGKIHIELYDRILTAFDSEKKISELSIEKLQERLVESLIDEVKVS